MEEWGIQRLAVQCYAFNIFVLLFVVFYYDTECLFFGQINNCLVEGGTSDRIYRFAGTYLIESHRIEYIPGRHLSAVFITWQSVCTVGILALINTVYQFLCSPRAVDVVVQVNDVMTRFIAVRILSDKAADVWRNHFSFEWWIYRKQWVEFLYKSVFTSH